MQRHGYAGTGQASAIDAGKTCMQLAHRIQIARDRLDNGIGILLCHLGGRQQNYPQANAWHVGLHLRITAFGYCHHGIIGPGGNQLLRNGPGYGNNFQRACAHGQRNIAVRRNARQRQRVQLAATQRLDRLCFRQFRGQFEFSQIPAHCQQQIINGGTPTRAGLANINAFSGQILHRLDTNIGARQQHKR